MWKIRRHPGSKGIIIVAPLKVQRRTPKFCIWNKQNRKTQQVAEIPLVYVIMCQVPVQSPSSTSIDNAHIAFRKTAVLYYRSSENFPTYIAGPFRGNVAEKQVQDREEGKMVGILVDFLMFWLFGVMSKYDIFLFGSLKSRSPWKESRAIKALSE